MGLQSKDKRDIYYKMAKQCGYRARSAFKLLHIDETFNIFSNSTKYVVDLCAAPGGWTQICAQKEHVVHVVGVDLLEILPIEKTTLIKGDITSPETHNEILNVFKGYKADLILCDGAPDITGISEFDEYYQNKLIICALETALKIGAPKSTFISKIFRGKETHTIINHILQYYEDVKLVKPISCRNNSIESFILATNKREVPIKINNKSKSVILFSCGTGPDADQTVEELDVPPIKHQFPPTDPAYKNIIEYRRRNN